MSRSLSSGAHSRDPLAHPGYEVANLPVMPALVAGIHVLLRCCEDVDGRIKPGHDKSLSETPALALTVGGRFNGAKGHSR
jgi:hypothetical protein